MKTLVICMLMLVVAAVLVHQGFYHEDTGFYMAIDQERTEMSDYIANFQP